jgi:putative photosynthetic complex assembly protein 2
VADHAFAALYVLFVWWFSTGAVLYVVGLPRRSFRWTLLTASGLLAAALHLLAATAEEASVAGAYVAFTAAILVWAWQEVAFLTGFVTGSRRSACPPGATGWRRAFYAFQAIAHHEVALVVLGAAVVAVTWGGANQVGVWTFAALWTMRLSSKLNLFLGVRNLNAEFLPSHLRYIGSYFTRRSMNPLYPVSVVFATAAGVLLGWWSFAPSATRFEATALALLAALIALAVVEHWLMMLPLHAVKLWKWGLRSRDADPAQAEPTQDRFVTLRAPRGTCLVAGAGGADITPVRAPATLGSRP